MRTSLVRAATAIVVVLAAAAPARSQDCTDAARKTAPPVAVADGTMARSLRDFQRFSGHRTPIEARAGDCVSETFGRAVVSPSVGSIQSKRLVGALAQTFDGMVWSDFARFFIEYDAGDRPISFVTEYWDGVGDAWVPASRESSSYNEAGMETSTLSEYWDSGVWVPVERTTHLFDGGGQQVGSETESWSGSEWVPLERVTWTTNVSGLPVDIETWNHDGFDWTLYSLEQFEYDMEGREIEWTYTETAPGGLSERVLTAYGQDGSIVQVSQLLIGGNWENQYRSELTSDELGRPVQQLVQASDSMGGWRDLFVDYYTYNDVDGWARRESWSMEGEVWVPGAAETTSFDGEGDLTVVLSQFWDATAEGWVDSYRLLFIYDSSIAAEDESPLPSVATLDVYPSPAVHDVNVLVSLAEAGPLRVEVFDLLGRQVALLADREEPAGRSELRWSTDGLPSGVYLVRLAIGGRVASRPVVVARL